MPIKLHCPRCAKELSAPDELLGKTVACPRCSERFPVDINGDESHDEFSGAYPPGVNAFPPGYEPPRTNVPKPPGSPAAPVTLSPAPLSSEDVTPPPIAGAPPVSPNRSSTTSGPPPRNPSPPPRSKPTTARFRTEEDEPAKPKRRTVQAARLITVGQAASHVRLGADGQLPQLHLKEGEQKEKAVEEKQGVNPLILIAVLVSALMSVAVLFLDDEMLGGSSQAKEEARRQIVEHYTKTDTPIDPKSLEKPYQYYLREAINAHSKGDYAAELWNYRHVMDMLHSEGKSEFGGLTGHLGSLENPQPESDRHLEQQLTILLGN